jgi:L-aminopeptidase/D-esterase-like protein
MITPGARNAITDVAGLRVGVAHDASVRTGVTVLLPDQRAVGAVDVRGGGTGTREIELLGGDGTVDAVDALVLSGGSAFGLAAADAVASWLAGQARGFPVGDMRVPLVPGAILFDLLNGGDKSGFRDGSDDALPYRDLSRKAVEAVGLELANGNAGAGFGATTTGHDGRRLKGGQGSASFVMDGSITIGALAAVNAVGSPVANLAGQFHAGPVEQGDEFGGRGGPHTLDRLDHPLDKHDSAAETGNTTLAVVATDAALDQRQARRVAMMAQAGLARAIRPAFSPMDGDVVFALSTGVHPVTDTRALSRIGMLAADCLARAVARGVYHATGLDDVWPDYKTVYRANLEGEV